MLQFGQNIQQSQDPLTKVTEEYLFHQIKQPKPSVLSLIQQLRIIRSVDSKQYSILKRQLPYVVCGIFNPPFRKTENFAWIDHFIVDIDHLIENEIDIEILQAKLKEDKRLEMMFVSPSENGIKLLYSLREKCYDAGLFTLFYKSYVDAFGKEYHIQAAVDTRTSDVTRACFLSYDACIYYNPNAEKVDVQTYLNPEDMFAISTIRNTIRKEEKKRTESEKAEVRIGSNDPDVDAMKAIRSTLNPRTVISKDREVYVPEVLNEIMNGLENHLSVLGLKTKEIVNIQYGKKIKLNLGAKMAEVNVFYGKKGFSIVASPKSGTSTDLNSLSVDCITDYLSINGYL